jgi:hypothetical protein
MQLKEKRIKMIFKTEIFEVTFNGMIKYPVGTPKIIRELAIGDEIYFDMEPKSNRNKVDNITIYNITQGIDHTMKQGNFFKSISSISMVAK